MVNCKRCGKPFVDNRTNKNQFKKVFCSHKCQTRYHSYNRYKTMMAKDPEYNAKKQREWRKKNPIRFNMNLAKFYLKRLTVEQTEAVFKEILDEAEKKK